LRYAPGALRFCFCCSTAAQQHWPTVFLTLCALRQAPYGVFDMWYVINTKPKEEYKAEGYLTAKGLEIFNPRLEDFTIRNGKITKEVKPLFPGYIFGNFDLERDYTLVKWGRGVKKLVSFGGLPTPVSEVVIDEIKKRVDGLGIVRLDQNFKPNDVVRIKAGPFRDFLGIFQKWIPEKERVRILLNLIAYQPSLEIHYGLVEKVH